jgi:rhomboid protease GluP
VNEGISHTATEPPRRSRPVDSRTILSRFPVTYGTIGFTVIVFIFQWLGAYVNGNGVVCGQGDVICQAGAKINQAIAAGEIWRFITPIFIHVNAMHILVNMYSLHAVGPSVEMFYGKERTAILYLLSGISGVAFSFAFSSYISVGASGAIFGIVGALAWLLFRHRHIFGAVAKNQLQRIIFVIFLNLILGMSAMIDNWGHIGGLLGGIFIGWLIGPRWERVQTPERPDRLIDKRPWEDVRANTVFAVAIVAFVCLAAIFSPRMDTKDGVGHPFCANQTNE